MKNDKKKKRPYVELRYGLKSHYHEMTDGERSLFIGYLLNADWNGKFRGTCWKSDADMAIFMKWTESKFWRYKVLLKKRKFIETTQGKMGVKILKYDNPLPSSVEDVDNYVDNSSDFKLPS